MGFNKCVSRALETCLATTCAYPALEELVGTLRIRQVACSNTLGSKHLTIHTTEQEHTYICTYIRLYVCAQLSGIFACNETTNTSNN